MQVDEKSSIPSEPSLDSPVRRPVQIEHTGPWWTHPYVLYLWITGVLFAVLLFFGWLGWKNGWVANS